MASMYSSSFRIYLSTYCVSFAEGSGSEFDASGAESRRHSDAAWQIGLQINAAGAAEEARRHLIGDTSTFATLDGTTLMGKEKRYDDDDERKTEAATTKNNNKNNDDDDNEQQYNKNRGVHKMRLPLRHFLFIFFRRMDRQTDGPTFLCHL